MRVGIISDIHSNVEALRAVLQEFEDRHVEKIICLGDIIGLGSRPDECVALLQENSDKILCAVRGNHENYLLKELPVHNHGDKTKAKLPKEILDLFRWNHRQIVESSLNYLKKLPEYAIVEVEGTKIFVSHYPKENDVYRQFYYKPNLKESEEIFAGYDADVYLYGHTHIRNLQQSKSGKLYINPGSVGCPIGTDSASAGILDVEKDKITYEQLDIVYDIETVIDDMLQHSSEVPAIDYTVRRFYRED